MAAFDASVAGDEAVAEDDLFAHAKLGGAMGYELVGFLECAFIEKKLDALAGGHFAKFVFPGAAFFAPACFGEFVALF